VDIDGLEDLLWLGLLEYADAQAKLACTFDRLQAPEHKGLQTEVDKVRRSVRTEIAALRPILKEIPDPRESHDPDCKPMGELLCEIEKFADDAEIEPDVADAGLLAAIQAVAHWEISRLGALRSYADDLGHQKIADFATATLEARGHLDRNLTRLAETGINFRAADH